MVPEFERCLEVEASAEQGEHPLDQENLGLDAFALQLLVGCRLVVLQQQLEGAAGCLDEVVLEAEGFSEEGVAEDEVGEEVEGFGFAEDGYEDDGWVGHALDVADIWPEDVEELEELADVCDQTALRLILRLTVERSLYVLLDLHPHLLNHPVLLSPLQQLQVQRVTHPHPVLHQTRPHRTPQLLRHELLNQRQALLPKDRHSQLRVAV